MSTKAKVITTISTIIVVGFAIFFYFRFYFVYGTGVNSGDLNYFQREGVIFKTYEGKLIQTGFRSAGTAKSTATSNIRSNEFKFSVEDDAVAEKLMRSSGKTVELKWRQFFAPLPWRGNSKYVVTEVLSVSDSYSQPGQAIY
mgnify:CR=1 FL=1